MVDYSNHPYVKLLTHIEKGCQRLKEERDFIGYLLLMEHAASIEILIKIYNNIFKLLAQISYGTLDFPNYWYLSENWGHNNHILVDDLNCFLNENILKWYNRQEIPTEQQSILCLSNLRESENAEDIQNKILERYSIYHSKEDEKISPLFQMIKMHYYQMKQIATNSKFGFTQGYITNSKILAGYGRIFDVAEIFFGNDYNISYEGLAEQYKKDIELVNNKKEQNILVLILKVLVFILVSVLLILIFDKLSGFFGIIILIGFLGMLPKLLLKGKL
jgi:hypothetical protein